MSAFRDKRQNRLTILIDLHRVVIEKLTLIRRLLHVPLKDIKETVQALLHDKRKKNLQRRAKLAHQIMDIVLIIALADNELRIGVYVKYGRIAFFASEFPEFFLIARCHSRPSLIQIPP